jgi:hypothetical protein
MPPEAAPAAAGTSQPAPVVSFSPSLTSLIAVWHEGVPVSHAASIIAAASSSLVNLAILGTIVPGDPAAYLPDLRACTALQSLYLGGSETAKGEDLVKILEPLAPSLREVTLDGWRCISPAIAEALQQILPHLVAVSCQRCRPLFEEDPSGGSEEEQLQRLRGQLRPGLKLTVS